MGFDMTVEGREDRHTADDDTCKLLTGTEYWGKQFSSMIVRNVEVMDGRTYFNKKVIITIIVILG